MVLRVQERTKAVNWTWQHGGQEWPSWVQIGWMMKEVASSLNEWIFGCCSAMAIEVSFLHSQWGKVWMRRETQTLKWIHWVW